MMHEVSGKRPSTDTELVRILQPTNLYSVITHRKKNRKWKLLQAYLPYLGWGILCLVAVVLAYRERTLSSVGLSLHTATQDLSVLKTQQTQLQVCLALILYSSRH